MNAQVMKLFSIFSLAFQRGFVFSRGFCNILCIFIHILLHKRVYKIRQILRRPKFSFFIFILQKYIGKALRASTLRLHRLHYEI